MPPGRPKGSRNKHPATKPRADKGVPRGPQKNPRNIAEYQVPAFKECNDCSETMPLELFYRHPRPRDGRMGHCKACHEVRQDKRLNTVAWADKKAIRRVYAERDRLNAQGGERYVVDHIIPCNGRKVSGLHVAENLRVITWQANAEKYNKY